jgi:transposase
MAMIAKIKRMYFREKLSISENARRTSLTRNTIKAWLHKPDDAEPKYIRRDGPTKLTPHIEWLKQALETDTHRPKRERRTALRLYAEVKAKGFTGSYTRVSEFVRKWRAGLLGPVARPAFVPLKFALGEAFQFDWSEESLLIGGIHRKILVAHTKLCASRAFLLAAYPSQSHEMLFDAHTRAFRVFGGIPLRGIYDNMKTAVDRVQKGKGRIVNTRFSAMVAHYLFDADFCNVASGWEKGVVEKNVQDSRRRIWADARNQRFGNLAELNVWLEHRCRQLWSELAHPEYPGLTVAEVLELEQPQLMPMVSAFDG